MVSVANRFVAGGTCQDKLSVTAWSLSSAAAEIWLCLVFPQWPLEVLQLRWFPQQVCLYSVASARIVIRVRISVTKLDWGNYMWTLHGPASQGRAEWTEYPAEENQTEGCIIAISWCQNHHESEAWFKNRHIQVQSFDLWCQVINLVSSDQLWSKCFCFLSCFFWSYSHKFVTMSQCLVTHFTQNFWILFKFEEVTEAGLSHVFGFFMWS